MNTTDALREALNKIANIEETAEETGDGTHEWMLGEVNHIAREALRLADAEGVTAYVPLEAGELIPGDAVYLQKAAHVYIGWKFDPQRHEPYFRPITIPGGELACPKCAELETALKQITEHRMIPGQSGLGFIELKDMAAKALGYALEDDIPRDTSIAVDAAPPGGIVCPACAGESGFGEGESWRRCTTCDGKGRVFTPQSIPPRDERAEFEKWWEQHKDFGDPQLTSWVKEGAQQGWLAGRVGLLDVIDAAWGIIANASGGDWSKQREDWVQAAARWRDSIMPEVSAQQAAIASRAQECVWTENSADPDVLIAGCGEPAFATWSKELARRCTMKFCPDCGLKIRLNPSQESK